MGPLTVSVFAEMFVPTLAVVHLSRLLLMDRLRWYTYLRRQRIWIVEISYQNQTTSCRGGAKNEGVFEETLNWANWGDGFWWWWRSSTSSGWLSLCHVGIVLCPLYFRIAQLRRDRSHLFSVPIQGTANGIFPGSLADTRTRPVPVPVPYRYRYRT